ncbi:hypothetical protein EYF80_062380 [Liparis tanakae]|uniref:Uncharacterized protein n=1 Tax=Liparis tanakae TaxID=230148 RepID=A0A4Z2EF18_9TELE|nr:hypothetical protein EYF80_062380 [Liparis tanakae]
MTAWLQITQPWIRPATRIPSTQSSVWQAVRGCCTTRATASLARRCSPT